MFRSLGVEAIDLLNCLQRIGDKTLIQSKEQSAERRRSTDGKTIVLYPVFIFSAFVSSDSIPVVSG